MFTIFLFMVTVSMLVREKSVVVGASHLLKPIIMAPPDRWNLFAERGSKGKARRFPSSCGFLVFKAPKISNFMIMVFEDAIRY